MFSKCTSQYKRASTSETCQNQLAKHPNSTLSSKEKSPGAHWWTHRAWELVSLSRGVFSFHQGKAHTGSQCWAGEKQGGSLKPMVWAAARNILPHLFSGPARLLTAFPAYRHVSGTNGEKPGSQISREHDLTLAPKSVRKVGPSACIWKANKEVRLVERKVCFILEAGSQGQGPHIQRPTPPQPQSVGKNLYGQRERAPCINSAVSSGGRLETGHQSSNQYRLGYFYTVGILFQGQFVPISLRPVLGTVTAYIMATVWSSCSY